MPGKRCVLHGSSNIADLNTGVSLHSSPVLKESARYFVGDFAISSIPGGGGVLPIMAYTGRLRPKGVPYSGFRYKKG